MKEIKRIISCLDLVKEWMRSSKKIRQRLVPSGRILQEKIKEVCCENHGILNKISAASLSLLVAEFPLPWSLFSSSWIKEKMTHHLKFKKHSPWPILMEENRTPLKKVGHGFSKWESGRFCHVTCQVVLRFFKEN